MIIVLAQAHARPEHRDALVEQLAKASAISRDDPGCVAYSFQCDIEDPNSFTSIERWESRADLDAHLATTHVADLVAALQDMVSAAPVITVYEVSSETTL